MRTAFGPLRRLSQLTPFLMAGLTLAAGLGTVGVIRRDRPLHAYGEARSGWLEVERPAGIGVPLLDHPGCTAVLVRTSRAMSLTRRGPDVMGLAVRTDVDGNGGDLLFASTGGSLLGRYLLRLHTRPTKGTLTTLLPMDTTTGTVQLRLRGRGSDAWDLAWSRPLRARWQPLGRLTLTGAAADPGHFNPTGNPPEGMTPPGWVRALRAPAYLLARHLPGQGH